MGLGEMVEPPMDNRSIGGWGVSSSCEMKEFSFAVFYNKTSIEKDFGHNVVATK